MGVGVGMGVGEGYRVTGKKKGLQSTLTTASLFIKSYYFMNKIGCCNLEGEIYGHLEPPGY